MKALFLSLLTLSFCSSVFAVEINASLKGLAVESQLVQQKDGNRTLNEVGAASMKEMGRSQSKNEVTIFLLGQSENHTQYLSVLHEINNLTLTLDMSALSPAGDNTKIAAQVQILGDDDQIRKAEGSCISLLGAQLTCRLAPTFNAYGLIENTQLTLDLQ